MCQQKPIARYELVELPMTLAQNKVYFPDVQNLRNQADRTVIIRNINLITTDLLTVSPTGSGLAVSPTSELQKAVLTLFVKNEQSIYRIPLLQLNRTATPAGAAPFNIAPQAFDDLRQVDWVKSYLEFSSLPDITTPYSILLGVEYLQALPQQRN